MDVVRINAVTKEYDKHKAVEELSLNIPQGCIYGLLGPNGAGKTTTIRMMLHIIMPDSGTIERKAIPATDEWLKRLDLFDYRDKKVDELSKGMQQKVQFIGTILHDPELVILDEPFSGMDPVNLNLLKDIIMELKGRGRTIILSTHQMEQAERLCDSICLIDRAKKVFDGSLQALKQKYGKSNVVIEFFGEPVFLEQCRDIIENVNNYSNYVEIRLKEGANAQVLLEHAIKTVTVDRFQIMEPSLHEIFVDIVTQSRDSIEEQGEVER
jgi:ABC-2 type transport system ATP-binding protein